MLRLLTATTILFIATSAWLGYQLYRDHPLTHNASAACTDLPYNYKDSSFEGIIGYQTAQALYNNYGSDKAKSWITSTDSPNGLQRSFEDTRSVWFSLDRLKNFIWHIEEANCANGCTDQLGLRIYFAKYPDFNAPGYNNFADDFFGLADVPREYASHHTLFMMPTYKNSKGQHIDFYPGDKTCHATLSSAPLIENKHGDDVITKIPKPTPYIMLMGTLEDAQNHGGLIPPGDPTGTLTQQ